jgi:hypothetical protein
MNHDLYRISPAYRRVEDELFALRSRYGALVAAYGNAISDQQRIKAEFAAAIDQIDQVVGEVDQVAEILARYALAQRDDPGRGGSGGTR